MSAHAITNPKHADYVRVPRPLWRTIKRYLPPLPKRHSRGRPPADTRAVINGIWYILLTGCQLTDAVLRWRSRSREPIVTTSARSWRWCLQERFGDPRCDNTSAPTAPMTMDMRSFVKPASNHTSNTVAVVVSRWWKTSVRRARRAFLPAAGWLAFLQPPAPTSSVTWLFTDRHLKELFEDGLPYR